MDAVSVPPVVRIGRWHCLGASVLVVGLVGLELRAILGPYEDWPFTSAPMFARYHAAEDPLFELRLIARHLDGSEHEIVPQRDLGVGELAFRRQFFSKHYGSVDPKHPGGHMGMDDRKTFEKRLETWMRRVARVYERTTGHALAGMRLEAWRIAPEGSQSRRVANLELGRDSSL